MLGEEGIFEGTLSHSRRFDIRHSFSYRIWMVLAHISESRLPWLVRPRWRRYLSREQVLNATGITRCEQVFVLTQPGLVGRSFNPVSFYFVVANHNVQGIVAHVRNTPWDEQHVYALNRVNHGDGVIEWAFDKAFHVSPFLPMQMQYTWRFTLDADRILVTSQVHDHGEPVFSAALHLTRREPVRKTSLRVRVRYPAQNLLSLWRIYWQALLLKLKGAQFHAHPDT